MRYERYRRIESQIVASDNGGIWERWRYGRRLLCDSDATTPQGNLKHGVLDRLIRGAARSGRKLSEREIQRRLQAARTWPTEDQIRHAVSDFETWHDLVASGFPAYEAPPGARPYNPLETDELVSQNDDRGRRLIEYSWYSEGLFDHLTKAVTLAEMRRYAEEQDEITARFAAAGQRRWLMLNELIKAVNGDESKTWQQAEDALEDDGNG